MTKTLFVFTIALLSPLLGMNTISVAQEMDQNLNAKQQAIVPIAAFTASGNIGKLKTALNEGLDAGLTVNEIKEILVQMYAYAGFPRSLNGLDAFMSILNERKEKGIKDKIGKEPGPFPKDKTVLELGTEVQTKIVGQPVKGPVYDFAPAIDEYLKTHLFGDIFGRDVLDFQQREIATISALASLDGAESQLQGHFGIGKNVGLTEAQLQALIDVLEVKVGRIEAARAKSVLTQTLRPDESVQRQNDVKIQIFKAGSQKAYQGSQEYFTGTVRIDPQFAAKDQSRVSGGLVTFEPGARAAWHTHPVGQTLIVASGVGRVQQWGGEIQEIKAGDVVWFPAGVKHWHGAAPTTAMSHYAIQEEVDGSAVEWMEHVSDEQYNR